MTTEQTTDEAVDAAAEAETKKEADIKAIFDEVRSGDEDTDHADDDSGEDDSDDQDDVDDEATDDETDEKKQESGLSEYQALRQQATELGIPAKGKMPELAAKVSAALRSQASDSRELRDLQQQAVDQFGLDAVQVAQIRTPAELRRAISLLPKAGQNGDQTTDTAATAPTEIDWGEGGEEAVDEDVARILKQQQAELNAMRKQNADERAAFQNDATQRQEQVEIRTFVETIDGLENEELFGKAGSDRPEGSVEFANAGRLGSMVNVLRQRNYEAGQDDSVTPDLIRRAYAIEFAEEVQQRNQADRKKRAQNGSGKILSTGSSKKRKQTGAAANRQETLSSIRAMIDEN